MRSVGGNSGISLHLCSKVSKLEKSCSGSPEIERTADGSPTLWHAVLGEAYHSLRGAVGESRHVYIEAGLCYVINQKQECEDPEDTARTKHDSESVSGHTQPDRLQNLSSLRIFEMGFGSGLNAWLTAQEVEKCAYSVEYVAIEQYPVDLDTVQQLDYAADPLFVSLHRVPWNENVQLTRYFTLKKVNGSLLDYRFDTTFDLIYFDAFAPDCQPELWSQEVFGRLYDSLRPGGVLVTYSAKGVVKENLRAAGFTVHRLPGALGKHHMLRAEKTF